MVLLDCFYCALVNVSKILILGISLVNTLFTISVTPLILLVFISCSGFSKWILRGQVNIPLIYKSAVV